MKVFPNNEKVFFEKDFNQCNAILVFGQDSSLILEKISILEKKIIQEGDDSSFSKITLDYNNIEQDYSILTHEIQGLSLINKRKFILIENLSASITKEFKEILSSYNSEHMVVLKAGELSPSSSLRKFFESENNLAAIPCYAPDTLQIKQLVHKKIHESNIDLPQEYIDFIVKNSRGEYSSMVMEIDKILCYAEGGNKITLDVIKELLSAPSEKNSYDPLIKSIISGDYISSEKEFIKLTYSGVHVVAIARNIANYFIKLLKVKTQIYQGKNEKESISSIKPPIFFKNLPEFRAGIKKYTIQDLVLTINSLTKIEEKCKTQNTDSKLVWEKDFFSIFLEKTIIQP